MSALFFQNGVSIGASAGWCGYTGSNNYVVRYQFTTPPQGASAVSIALSGIYYGNGASSQGFGFKISTSSVAYANARNTTPDSDYGVMSYSSTSGYSCIMSASGLNLTPSTVYYLFVFVATAGAEYYTGWNCVNPSIVCSGAYAQPEGSISSISSQVNTQSPLSLIVGGSPHPWHRASFSHKGNILGASAPFAASLSHVCPRDWMSADTKAQSIQVDVSVQGYADAACQSPVGNPMSAAFLLKADAGMRPVLPQEAVTVAAVNEGAAAAFTELISGISRAGISFDSGKIDLGSCAGAGIESFALSYKDSYELSAEPYVETAVLGGETVINCIVIDSRGREGSLTISVKPVPYVPPSLSSIELQRCDLSGNDTESSWYFKLRADSAFTSLNGKNSIKVSTKVQPVGGAWGSGFVLEYFESGVWSDKWSQKTILGGINPNQSFRISITISDALGCSATYIKGLYLKSWAMKFNSTGTAVGFGMEPTVENAVQMPDIWRFYPGAIVLADTSYGFTEPEQTVADPVEGQLYFLLSQ